MAPQNAQNIVIGAELERLIDIPLGELLLRLLKSFEDNILQVDGETGEELPASLLLKKSTKLAKWLLHQGIKVNDNISINSENRLEFCIVPVATLFSGATFAPLNPDYTPRELKHVLGLSKPKLIFCSSKTIDKIVSILPDHPYVEKLVLFGDEPCSYAGVVRYDDIVKGAEGE